MSEDAREGIASGWFAENLRAAREHAGMSQSTLAGIMSDLGYPFHQQTIARIEAGERKVEVEEAFALARSVRADVEILLRPPGVARDGLRLLDAARRVQEARQAIRNVQDRYAAERGQLEALIAATERAGNAERLAREIGVARRALAGPRPVDLPQREAEGRAG